MANNQKNYISYELLGRIIDGYATHHECLQTLTTLVHHPHVAECLSVAIRAKILTDHFNQQYETI